MPLKPHKCDFCGKAFKRPQDLKKHVKTHADDSEIRSPEPGLKHHHPDMMFPQNPKGYAAATHYFDTPMNGVSNQAYAHGAPQYYSAHGPPPPAANPHSYGNVYYALSQGHDGTSSYDRKRGYDALNEFFGDLKRRQFDPNSYAAVGQRLLGLQALQLPILNGPVPEYQPMPAGVAVGGGGGYSPGGSQAPAYHLPPMSNVRTKNDLINIDQFLEQMQNTIYESDENVAAAGVAQPGAHYVHGGMSYRHTNSPPSQLPPSHVTATTSAPMMAASAHSPSVGTPALTPPSSAQSYTSNRSPVSMPQHHRVSPPHESGAGMYPRLPSATMADNMAAGYPTASGAAPPSTLGAYDDDRRRYTGGTLQRARPAERDLTENRMDTSTDSKDGDRTPTKGSPLNISESLIDPALSGPSSDPDQEAAKRTAQAATEVAERDVNVAWVEKVRLLENLRRLVSELLEAGHFGADAAAAHREAKSSSPMDSTMEGIETNSARAPSAPVESTPEAVSYPTLRGLDEDEDGDANMPGADA